MLYITKDEYLAEVGENIDSPTLHLDLKKACYEVYKITGYTKEQYDNLDVYSKTVVTQSIIDLTQYITSQGLHDYITGEKPTSVKIGNYSETIDTGNDKDNGSFKIPNNILNDLKSLRRTTRFGKITYKGWL